MFVSEHKHKRNLILFEEEENFTIEKASRKGVALIKLFMYIFRVFLISVLVYTKVASTLYFPQVCSRSGLPRFVVLICSIKDNISTHRLRHNRQINCYK